MRNSKEIYNEAAIKIHNNGNQGFEMIGRLGIEIAQKEMFYFLYSKAELDENKNVSLLEFFDKMDCEIVFNE